MAWPLLPLPGEEDWPAPHETVYNSDWGYTAMLSGSREGLSAPVLLCVHRFG